MLKRRIFFARFCKTFFIIHTSPIRRIAQKFYDDLSMDVISLLEEFFEYCPDVHFVRVPLIFIYVRKK